MTDAFSQYNERKEKFLQQLNFKKNDDTSKVDVLNKLSEISVKNHFGEAYTYGNRALDLSVKLNYIIGKVHAYNNLGDAYWYKSDYAKAQDYYFKAYKINDSLNNEREIARSLYNVGWIICIQQNNFKEIDYLYRSLSIFEKLKDDEWIIRSYNAIGNVYCSMYELNKNASYFDSSLYYYNKGVSLSVEKNLNKTVGMFYVNIGTLMSYAYNYKAALEYAYKYYDEYKNSSDSIGLMSICRDIASYEMKLGNVEKATTMLLSLEIRAKRNESREMLKDSYFFLDECFRLKGDIKKAYSYFHMYNQLNDSITKNINSSSLNDLKETFEIEKRESSIRDLTQANEIQELKAKQNKLVLFAGTIVLLVIISIAYYLYKRNIEKGRINYQLQEQNSIIRQKKQEIESSIQYAKGIQTSFFPDIDGLNKVFPESFIFYQPKDVVSGDFYWFHLVDDCFYCVAADCTGHGVPGALMSIVSVDKITQAIFENKLTDPSEILKFLNIEIKNALKQHDDAAKQKDGLDIALIKINLKTSILTYSAANRPLFIIRNSELTEYCPDKTAIAGFTPIHYKFTQTDIKLEKNDCVYIFSDGYPDQFGGRDGKKFMTKNFKSLLKSVSHKDMKSQESEIIDTHFNWKGTYEQVDDILVIGVKI